MHWIDWHRVLTEQRAGSHAATQEERGGREADETFPSWHVFATLTCIGELLAIMGPESWNIPS